MTIERDNTLRDRHRAAVARMKPPCWLCGGEIDYSLKYPDPGSFVLDHVVPLAKGGSDALSNKKAAHRMCNSRKSDKTDNWAPVKRSGSIVLPDSLT